MSKNVISEHAGEVVGYAKMFAGQHIRLFKLELAERLSKITAGLITISVAFVLMLFILLLLSLGLGAYLGERWSSYSQAFFAIAGGYFLLGLLILFFRRTIVVNPIVTLIIKEMMDEGEEDK